MSGGKKLLDSLSINGARVSKSSTITGNVVKA